MSKGGDVASSSRRADHTLAGDGTPTLRRALVEHAETSPARRGQIRAYNVRLRGRERATAIAGGIVTRMRRDAVFLGGSVERRAEPAR